ncbi:sulfurtransferase complex subunit TusC [Shewanella sp. 202IG2-18]|uniref:sulfurtransferase complex subunit TusC n=1 Tax=Parashewanella hymeniacidonis TaxID=2807618 RepID=UPI001960BC0D|nr:sulfurtransferase complex subunit TusC [Parashewanella hymeniacidonis]MBM7074520.1 sulfurtransferase complex subunit TusC [Parashewanella hymeniacidonis]
MKQLTIIFRSSPAYNCKGREALDLAMLSASFDQHVKLIFLDEGVFNLLKGQSPELLGGKDYLSTLKALPLYDIDDVYVCEHSLSVNLLEKNELFIDCILVTQQRIRTLINEADEVLIF